ncbi:MAG: Hsp20/alpha crystallin family protein [Deltaproteobacteria bacterium]|nr:Hsp20/alpha crystallin family protein [Deltaproteobacteria bacterium]
MHRLIKIRIMRDYENLEERVRVWREVFKGLAKEPGGFRPHADLVETSQGLVLRLEVPGMDPDELSVCLAGHELIIRGRRRFLPPEGAKRFLLRELVCGPFERSFLVPIAVDPEEIKAHCADGILEILLPRSAPRRIPVKEITEDQE